MRRKKPKEGDEGLGMMMTPMIDIVFQLIVFFILVLDFVRQSIEKVKLPSATEVKKTKYSDPTLLVVNITKKGRYMINGREYFDPTRNVDPGKERMAFTKLEELFNRRRHNRRYQEVPGRPDTVKYFMLVRADRSTDFEHVQRLLMMATRYGGVNKVMFAVEERRRN
jgi:biopolymer transport protein ExbD